MLGQCINKNGAKVTEELRIVLWRPAPYILSTGLPIIIPPNQHLHERHYELLRGYDRSCGKYTCNSPSPRTGYAHSAKPQK
jgi:hypothetical protein